MALIVRAAKGLVLHFELQDREELVHFMWWVGGSATQMMPLEQNVNHGKPHHTLIKVQMGASVFGGQNPTQTRWKYFYFALPALQGQGIRGRGDVGTALLL